MWESHKFREKDVHIRGIVEPMHGRTGMALSHARQFYGGPPKFKPNPRPCTDSREMRNVRRWMIRKCARTVGTEPS